MARTLKSDAGASNNGRSAIAGSMDVEDALQRLGHDEQLFREIVQIYAEDSPLMLQTIHDAVANADSHALKRAAHSLKGMTATLSAQAVAGAAYRLEQVGTTGNFTDASLALRQLDERMDELNAAVREYLKSHR